MTIPRSSTAAIFGCEGPRLSDQEKSFFRDAAPLGFILFARNITSAPQTQMLCRELRDSVGWNAPILIDQEGGRVQRYGPPIGRAFLPALDQIKRAGDNAALSMQIRGRLIADELMQLGIDVNCAPLADIAREETHPFLLNRCYGYSRDEVAANARAMAKGLMDGGVLPVVKHMPGHGLGVVDSHHDLPTTDKPASYLQHNDFGVFQDLNDLPMGMSAHVIYSQIDDRPATTSPVLIDKIRTYIGFEGLLMTDDINMEALKDHVSVRAQRAIDAGIDIVLHCNGKLPEMQAIADKVGPMTDAAFARAQKALAARTKPKPVDIPALDAQLEALLNGSGNV